jgi:hypothetical protein
MTFDLHLADRIRHQLTGLAGISEKRMFGGIAFMLDGRMFVGIVGSALMARVGPAAYRAALARAFVREMDFTGKPMAGYVFVAPEGIRTESDLQGWLDQCLAFARTLPPRRVNPDNLATLPNLGKKSREMLAAANITTLAALQSLGAVRAYLAVKRVSSNASLNLLWALEGAISGRDWKDVARENRLELLMALEDAEKAARADG